MLEEWQQKALSLLRRVDIIDQQISLLKDERQHILGRLQQNNEIISKSLKIPAVNSLFTEIKNKRCQLLHELSKHGVYKIPEYIWDLDIENKTQEEPHGSND